MGTTIRRNQNKKIASLFDRATAFTGYSLSNGFGGTATTREHVERTIAGGGNGLRLTHYAAGQYRADLPELVIVHIHSNLWFQVAIGAQTEKDRA